MTINDACEIIYANEISSSYGVGIASAIGSVSRSGSVETRSIITSKNTSNNTFNIHGITYDEPLQLDLIFYNLDETFIDAYKERVLKKWLLKNNYNWIQVNQSDMDNSCYYVIGKSVELINVGEYTGGLKVSFQASDPWAWSTLQTKTFSVSGTLSKTLNLNIDFDEYVVYPQLKISPTVNGTVSIANTTTNETINLTNCVTTETIYINCANDKISSSSGRVMIDSWNKNSIGLVEGLNTLNFTGNFTLSMSYRLPIRIGN